MLERLRRDLAKEYSANTVKLTMAYAGMILRAARASGRIVRDPTAGLKQKRRRAGEKDDRVRPEDVPTRAEALAILTGTPSSFRAAVALGLAGLRVGEVLGLTADRIVIDKRRVTIDRQMQRCSRVYAHWLRDDRDVPAAVLDRVLAPGDALRARDEASDAGS